MENVLRIVKVEPGKPATETRIVNRLEDMQYCVGGDIGVYTITKAGYQNAVLVYNEEGKYLGLPMNRALYGDPFCVPFGTKALQDIICGTFFICGVDPKTQDFTSLTVEQVQEYMKKFKTPERFCIDPKRKEVTIYRENQGTVYHL